MEDVKRMIVVGLPLLSADRLPRVNRVILAGVSMSGLHAVACVEFSGEPGSLVLPEPYRVYQLSWNGESWGFDNSEGYTARDVAMGITYELVMDLR